MSVTCKDLVEVLIDYVEGTMPCDRRAELEAHMADCPCCEHYLESYKATVGLAGRLRACEPLPGDVEERLRKFVAAQTGCRGL